MLSVASVIESQPDAAKVWTDNLRTLSTNESPVARKAGRRWRMILGQRSPQEIATLLRKSFGEGSPSSRRSELLDLIASTHPFAGIVSEADYRHILREEFSFR
jgi:hypothetical protein